MPRSRRNNWRHWTSLWQNIQRLGIRKVEMQFLSKISMTNGDRIPLKMVIYCNVVHKTYDKYCNVVHKTYGNIWKYVWHIYQHLP